MIEKLPYILYGVVTALAVIGWLSLIIFPRSSWSNFWLAGLAIPVLLSLVYMAVLLMFWFIPPGTAFSQFLSLGGLYKMYANPGLLLVSWINILSMDLVAGAWMARKAAQIRMPYLYLLPCLVLTFVFAGFGFSLFAIIAAMGGGWSQIAKFEGQPPTNSAPVVARPSA